MAEDFLANESIFMINYNNPLREKAMGKGQFRFDNLEHPLVPGSFILYVYSNIQDLRDKRGRTSIPTANNRATNCGESVQKTEGSTKQR